MPTVRIVVPPVLSVARPSLGTGLLKAALLRESISCDVFYANMLFARQFGCDYNELLAEKIDMRPLLAEWLFSWALYPERNAERDTTYIAHAKKYVDEKVVDATMEMASTIPAFVADLASQVLVGAPRIVGISTSFQQNTASLALARELKLRVPELVVCLGGANCEGPMGEAISRNFPFVDYVFSGESDITFPALVKQILLAGNSLQSNIEYKSGENIKSHSSFLIVSQPLTVHRTIPSDNRVIYGEPITDLNALPLPDYADYFSDLYTTGIAAEVRPALIFESSRGCWWGAKHHCKFCGLNGLGMGYRSKAPARVRQELAELSSRWKVRSFMAADNIINNEMINGVFGVNDLNNDSLPPYSLFYEVKSNLTHERLSRLAEGGVRWVQPGIESLDDEVLAMMDKGVTALQNVRFLRNCSELGIIPIWNLLWGFPGEGDRHYGGMARMVPFIEHLSPPRGPFRIRLDRFSPYFERAAEFGFAEARPMNGYSAIYNLPEKELRDLAYFFEDVTAEAERASEPLKDWCTRVAHWRERHFSSDGPATLSVMEIGGIGFLRDTRTISTEEYLFLDETDLRVIRSFRDPRKIDSALARSSDGDTASMRLQRISFEKLSERGVLISDKNVALSVAVDYSFSRDGIPSDMPNPFGEWRANFVDRSADSAARTFNRGHL